MKYLFWIISTIIAILTNYVMLAYGNHSFIDLNVWFILPAGAFGLGMLASSGYILWNRFFPGKKTENKTLNLILSSLIMILGFIGIHYIIYLSTYIDRTIGMNYTFKGSHISEFILNDGDKTTNFINYMKFNITNSSRTLDLRRIGDEIDLGSNATFNWISFGLSFIGYIGGSATVISESKEKHTAENANEL